MLAYVESCLDETDLKGCSSRVMKKVDIDETKVNSCLSENYMNGADYSCEKILKNSMNSYSDIRDVTGRTSFTNMPSISFEIDRDINSLIPIENVFAAFL